MKLKKTGSQLGYSGRLSLENYKSQNAFHEHRPVRFTHALWWQEPALHGFLAKLTKVEQKAPPLKASSGIGVGAQPQGGARIYLCTSGGSGLVVTGWVCPELAAVLTRLRTAGRFESRILMALLSRSLSFPDFLLFPTLGPFYRLLCFT